jgi:hypothetical protein
MAEELKEVEEEVVVEPQVEGEEPQEGDVEEKKEEASKEEAQEYTEDETQALESGWKPKDQWEGDIKKWVPAEEYNRRGELFGKIDSMGRDLRDTKKALRMLQDHHGKVKETEYNRALASVREAKKQALRDGDVDLAAEADERMIDMKAEQISERQVNAQQAAQPDPRFIQWADRNSWYKQDGEMRAFADDVGIAHAKANPEKSPEEVLKYVESRVKRTYAEKFTNPNRDRPNAVGGREVSSARKSPKDDFAMSEEERKVMMTFVNEGVMTKDQYIADLKAIKGVS